MGLFITSVPPNTFLLEPIKTTRHTIQLSCVVKGVFPQPSLKVVRQHLRSDGELPDELYVMNVPKSLTVQISQARYFYSNNCLHYRTLVEGNITIFEHEELYDTILVVEDSKKTVVDNTAYNCFLSLPGTQYEANRQWFYKQGMYYIWVPTFYFMGV